MNNFSFSYHTLSFFMAKYGLYITIHICIHPFHLQSEMTKVICVKLFAAHDYCETVLWGSIHTEAKLPR